MGPRLPHVLATPSVGSGSELQHQPSLSAVQSQATQFCQTASCSLKFEKHGPVALSSQLFMSIFFFSSIPQLFLTRGSLKKH